jgi:hypothetical protein
MCFSRWFGLSLTWWPIHHSRQTQRVKEPRLATREAMTLLTLTPGRIEGRVYRMATGKASDGDYRPGDVQSREGLTEVS